MRLPKLSPETMTPRQRALHDKIAGKRGKVGAPYQIWLYSPELCERVEALGAYLRWESAMAPKYRANVTAHAAIPPLWITSKSAQP